MLRHLTRPSAVLNTGRPSSTCTHTGDTCTLPSRLTVPRWPKLRPASNSAASAWGSTLTGETLPACKHALDERRLGLRVARAILPVGGRELALERSVLASGARTRAQIVAEPQVRKQRSRTLHAQVHVVLGPVRPLV